MGRKSKAQIKEEETRQKLFKMAKSLERLKRRWEKAFDEAYKNRNWLWRQMIEAEVYFKLLPKWEQDMLKERGY